MAKKLQNIVFSWQQIVAILKESHILNIYRDCPQQGRNQKFLEGRFQFFKNQPVPN